MPAKVEADVVSWEIPDWLGTEPASLLYSGEAEPCIPVPLIHLDFDLVRGLGSKPSVETATQVQVHAEAASHGYGSFAFSVKR